MLEREEERGNQNKEQSRKAGILNEEWIQRSRYRSAKRTKYKRGKNTKRKKEVQKQTQYNKIRKGQYNESYKHIKTEIPIEYLEKGGRGGSETNCKS